MDLEVDLHIERLIPHRRTIERMTAAEIMEVQLDEVRQVLNKNRRQRGRNIVFIHGVGRGVLRREIERLLRREYPNYRYWDAPFYRYGMGGAVQVRIQ